MVTNIFKSTKSDEFYIQTADKYYFPGDNIKGNIIFDVSKPVPTRHIIVSLESIIEVGGRSTPVFSPQSVFVAKGPEEGKVYELEAMRHSFPFKITIPSSCSLKIPSSLKIKDIVKVAYRLTAIHNRNFTLEKARIATPKIINILEMIDVHEEDYLKTYHDSKEFALTGETREVKVSTIIAKRAAVKRM
ncbi:hypothetical protein BDB01DRAFT_782443 [Pilobolus umbonatus]|nr:hypothetical protein BDB01DRAFT_782443 [Pilobolus umbonatus]